MFSIVNKPLGLRIKRNCVDDRSFFTRWFHNEFTSYIKQQTCFKVVLLLDNFSGHADLWSHDRQVKCIFLPQNCTILCQPLDLGIIAAFKSKCRNYILSILPLRIECEISANIASKRAEVFDHDIEELVSRMKNILHVDPDKCFQQVTRWAKIDEDVEWVASILESDINRHIDDDLEMDVESSDEGINEMDLDVGRSTIMSDGRISLKNFEVFLKKTEGIENEDFTQLNALLVAVKRMVAKLSQKSMKQATLHDLFQ